MIHTTPFIPWLLLMAAFVALISVAATGIGRLIPQPTPDPVAWQRNTKGSQ